MPKQSVSLEKNDFLLYLHLTQSEAAKLHNVSLSCFKRYFHQMFRPRIHWSTKKDRIMLRKAINYPTNNILTQELVEKFLNGTLRAENEGQVPRDADAVSHAPHQPTKISTITHHHTSSIPSPVSLHTPPPTIPPLAIFHSPHVPPPPPPPMPLIIFASALLIMGSIVLGLANCILCVARDCADQDKRSNLDFVLQNLFGAAAVLSTTNQKKQKGTHSSLSAVKSNVAQKDELHYSDDASPCVKSDQNDEIDDESIHTTISRRIIHNSHKNHQHDIHSPDSSDATRPNGRLYHVFKHSASEEIISLPNIDAGSEAGSTWSRLSSAHSAVSTAHNVPSSRVSVPSRKSSVSALRKRKSGVSTVHQRTDVPLQSLPSDDIQSFLLRSRQSTSSLTHRPQRRAESYSVPFGLPSLSQHHDDHTTSERHSISPSGTDAAYLMSESDINSLADEPMDTVSTVFDDVEDDVIVDVATEHLDDLPPREEIEIDHMDISSSPHRKRRARKSILRKRKLLELFSAEGGIEEGAKETDEVEGELKRRKTNDVYDRLEEEYGEYSDEEDSESDDSESAVTLGVKRPRPKESDEELSLKLTGQNFLPVKKRPRFSETISTETTDHQKKSVFLSVISFLRVKHQESVNSTKLHRPLFEYSPTQEDDTSPTSVNSNVPRSRKRIPIESPKNIRQAGTLLQSKEDILDFKNRSNEVIKKAISAKDEDEKVAEKPKKKVTFDLPTNDQRDSTDSAAEPAEQSESTVPASSPFSFDKQTSAFSAVGSASVSETNAGTEGSSTSKDTAEKKNVSIVLPENAAFGSSTQANKKRSISGESESDNTSRVPESGGTFAFSASGPASAYDDAPQRRSFGASKKKSR
eukprot:CAMPEP_0117443154 /NCGR_PEP_ID=MMETSP0759-20121206/4544_1 /TAXON_ID=63605 /ORGANISM="Percolomonas cosmopolitus, Strain WS" /LENGTH=863 /DNA_ID=CAMNT_0005235111 /DNA_START=182 /DNA_END=2774 /DNA_ORIENTATION=-